MTSSQDPEEEASALRARMAELSREIESRRPKAAAPGPGAPKPPDNTASAMSMGLRAGSEFVAAILVGGAIGWGIDRLLGSKPAFTIVFFLLGVAAGVWNVIRATSPKAR